jgi:hypothetical protein
VAKKKSAVIDDHPQLPGVEDERDEVLIKAAKRYRSLMLERKEAGEREESAHTRLKEIMEEKGMTQYQYKGLIILMDVSKKCKVKLQAEPAPSANGESE